ncbi:MAG: hypothetical protein ACRCZ9_00670 [Fusobacteriaceae bacterium]
MHAIFESKRTTDNALDEIIKRSFKPKDFNKYEIQLRTIKSLNYNTIEEYYQEIFNFVEMANICVEKEDHLTKREIFNYFYSGLSINHKRILIQNNLKDMKKAVELLSRMENLESELKNCNFNFKKHHQPVSQHVHPAKDFKLDQKK